MGFLDKIKRIFRSAPLEPDMVHDYFGLLHSEAIGDDDDFWQAEIIFEPTGQEICLNINAGLNGPTENQVQFYKWFVENYEAEFDRVSVNLISEFEEWFQKKMEGPFLRDFEFSSLTIPKDGNLNNPWELSFECLVDPNRHLFSAELRDNKVINVRADG